MPIVTRWIRARAAQSTVVSAMAVRFLRGSPDFCLTGACAYQS